MRHSSRQAWRIHLVAIVLVGIAAGLRLWPLEVLGARLAWLTFFPAVIVAALYGGGMVGLLATLLSCLAVLFFLPAFIHESLIKDSVDWLGFAVFVATGMMISGAAEATRRANARAKQSEEEFRKLNARLEDRVQERTAELETAGAALRDAETFTRATMNALFANISVLDEAGNIVAVNRVWRDFAAANGVDPDKVSEGSNYFDVCAAATGAERATALAIAEGIRSVALARTDRFDIEYPCHSPAERRWFIASVNRFLAGSAVRIVVSHIDITKRREAEDAIRRQSEELRAVNEDLERFNRSVVNRELRMIDLKQEINELCGRLGQPPRYAPDPGEEPA